MPKANKTQAASVDHCQVQERNFPLTLSLA